MAKVELSGSLLFADDPETAARQEWLAGMRQRVEALRLRIGDKPDLRRVKPEPLFRYSDAVRTPVTIVFDGGGHRGVKGETQTTPEVEILYSKAGQTADQIIERMTHRMQPYGEVLVVTDDHAERDTVIALGGFASSCDCFIQTVRGALRELESEVKHYNSAEKRRYKRL